MFNLIYLSSFVVVFFGCAKVNGQDYMRVKPAFLKACHIHQPEDAQCFSNAIQNFFTNWREGVPGLSSVPPIDPFRIKKVRISQKTDAVTMQIEMRNVVTHGMGNTHVVKSSINPKDYSFKLNLHIPFINIESDYKLKGHVLLLNLDGHGTMQSKSSDLDIVFNIKSNLRNVDGQYFFDVNAVTVDIRRIGGFQIQFTNLFNGNRDLEDSANQLFNNNWRDLFVILRPAIANTLERIIHDRYKKIFAYIPARYFIDDLP